MDLRLLACDILYADGLVIEVTIKQSPTLAVGGRCGSLMGESAQSMLAKWVLPLASNTAEGGPQPIVPKKKGRGGRPRSHAACTILAEDLRKAVAKR